MGAALAYYALFSVGPIALLITSSSGLLFSNLALRENLALHLQGAAGKEFAGAVALMLEAAYRPQNGILASVLGLMALLFFATSVLNQLRFSLGKIFLPARSSRSVLRAFFHRRLIATFLIVFLGFLLVSVVAAETLIFAYRSALSKILLLSGDLLGFVTLFIALTFKTLVFAFVFRVLSERAIDFRSALAGALLSAILFEFGSFAMSFYFSRTAVLSVYGAAGSIVAILLAAYYFSLIGLFGAHFAKAWSDLTALRL